MGAGIGPIARTPPYLPFLEGPAQVAPQLKPIAAERWLVPDTEVGWLPHKHHLLDAHREEVFALPETFAGVAIEAAGLILQHTGPHCFGAETPGPDRSEFETACRRISDDVCLMVREGETYVLRAACLCSPTFWSLRSMLHRPLGGLHQEVPGGDPGLASRISRVFAGLRPGLILERFNWTVQLGPEKFTPSSATMKQALKTLPPEDAAGRLHLRMERQTIRRLECEDAVLFTIRVSTDPLAPILSDRRLREAFAASWNGTSDDLAVYKGWPHYNEAVDCLIRHMSAIEPEEE